MGLFNYDDAKARALGYSGPPDLTSFWTWQLTRPNEMNKAEFQRQQRDAAASNAQEGGRFRGGGAAIRVGASALIGGAVASGVSGAFSASSASAAGTTGGTTSVIDISPDLLEGGEGTNIFVDAPYTGDEYLGPFTTNPTIADLEMGGEGAGLPGGLTPNASNFPSLSQIATGGKVILDLATQNRVAQAQIARARATQPAPVSTTPNFRSFLSHPAQSLGSVFPSSGNGNSGGALGSSVGGIPAFVIAGVILFLAFFLIKR